MVQKIKMNALGMDGEYVTVHPETSASQVIVDHETGETLEEKIANGSIGSGGSKVIKTPYLVTAETDGQTEFVFEDKYFNKEKDSVTVHLNGEFLHPGVEYEIIHDGVNSPKVKLTTSVVVGDIVHIMVERSVIVGESIKDFYRTAIKKFTAVAITEGQTEFNMSEDTKIHKDVDSTLVFLDSEPLEEGVDYEIIEGTSTVKLSTGAKKGSKVHMMLYTDVSSSGMDYRLENIPDGLIPVEKLSNDRQIPKVITVHGNTLYNQDINLYIDTINGDDSNEGLEKTKPIKSLNRLSDILSNSKSSGSDHNTLTVNCEPGIYKGLLNITDFDNIVIRGTGGEVIFENPGVLLDKNGTMRDFYGHIFATNGNSLIIRENISIRFGSEDINAVYRHYRAIKIKNVSYFETITNVTIDLEGAEEKFISTSVNPIVGIQSTDCRLRIRNLTNFKNIKTPLFIDGGNLNVNNHKVEFINCGPIELNLGVIYDLQNAIFENPRDITSNFKHITGGSVNVEDVYNSSIVEKGSNENGSYILYGNGHAILTLYKNISLVDLKTSTGTNTLDSPTKDFHLKYPYVLTEVLATELSGFVTKSTTGEVIKHVDVRKGSASLSGIDGFIIDTKSTDSTIDVNADQIRHLSVTVHGRWK